MKLKKNLNLREIYANSNNKFVNLKNNYFIVEVQEIYYFLQKSLNQRKFPIKN